MEDHLGYLKQIFHKLSNAKLSMKPRKCHFVPKEIQYFGHILSTTGITPLPLKMEAQMSQEHDGQELLVPSSHTHSQTVNTNKAPQNKKLIGYIMA